MGGMQEERLIVSPPTGMAAECQSPGGVSVKAGPARNDLVLVGFPHLPPILPHELHGSLDRFGPARKKIDPVHALIGDQSADPCRAFQGGFAREMAAVRKGQPIGLRQHLLADLGHAVADRNHSRASGSVEVALAGLIPEVDPFAPVDYGIGLEQIPVENMIVMRSGVHEQLPLSFLQDGS